LGPVYRDHGPSDKARYCRGLLDYSRASNRHTTLSTIAIGRMSSTTSPASEGARRTQPPGAVYQSIAKYPERWALDQTHPKDEEIRRIEREITKLAQYVRIRENEVTFQFLERKLREERDEFRREHPTSEGETVDVGAESAQARGDLRRSLQGFVDAKILRQGTNSRCRHCGSKVWQEISSLKQEFTCPGCGAPVHSAVESTWCYGLNTLLRSGIVAWNCGPYFRIGESARTG
jgi:hypothetical protein